MPTAKEEGWARGYEQAVRTLHAPSLATDPRARRAEAQRLRNLEASQDFQGVRHALDAAPGDLSMSHATASFYLGMTPGIFQKNLRLGPHPFGQPPSEASKDAVDAWFTGLVQAKHIKDVPQPRPLRLGRDLSNGRPYLLDASGVILADGQISSIGPEDANQALALGAGIRILSLGKALALPWRDTAERAAWAGYRLEVLRREASRANRELEEAQRQPI